MSTVDIISDLHLDFWVRPSVSKSYRTMKNFLRSLIPENPSKILLIAGDIGHYNYQNQQALIFFREIYDCVCWVHGNHDLYLINHTATKKYKRCSLNRLNNMIKRSNRIDGVHYLDGTSIEFNGLKIGGAAGWYDYSYGLNNFGKRFTEEMIHEKWKGYMNDYNLIYGKEPFNPLKYAKQENVKFNNLLDCDVIISHVGPCHGRLEFKYKTLSTAFYYFDGEDHLYNLDENTLWLYGHTHSLFEYQHKMGCRMITNPLGYPAYTGIFEENNKIRTIVL